MHGRWILDTCKKKKYLAGEYILSMQKILKIKVDRI